MSSGSLTSRIKSFIKRKTSQKYRFNLQYSSTYWDGLRNIEDLGRYSLIVGYSKFFFPNARILDLACGEGVLQERFSSSDYSYFMGIDLSDVAIDKAKKKENEKTRYLVGDLDKLDVQGTFDVIIYNECIYYLKDIKKSIQSVYKNLSPGGIFIFSNFNRKGREDVLGASLAEILDLVERTQITNLKGDSWTLHVYKMKQ